MALKLLAADFLQAFQKLLPRGRVWPRDPGTVQSQTLLGLNTVYERTTARANNLLIDAFPATTYELLPEWEKTLGLPDPCAGEAPTIQARVAQVVARFTSSGGQSAPYFIDTAARLGYTVTITNFAQSRFGARFGQPFGGVEWAYAWQVSAPQFTVQKFQFGASSLGEPFSYWNNNVLLCELRTMAPAHTILNFNFSE